MASIHQHYYIVQLVTYEAVKMFPILWRVSQRLTASVHQYNNNNNNNNNNDNNNNNNNNNYYYY